MSVCFQPHLRLIYLFLGSILISGLHSLPWLLGLNGGFFCLWLYLLRRFPQPLIPPFRAWLRLNYFSLLLFATLSWQIQGKGVSLNHSGVDLAWLITLRMNAVFLLSRLMLWQINDIRLVQAVAKLPISAKLIQLFVMTVHYINVFQQVNEKMYRAMQARGYKAGFNRRTLAVTAQRITLLLIHAYQQVERSEIALKARAFRFQNRSASSVSFYLWIVALIALLGIGY